MNTAFKKTTIAFNLKRPEVQEVFRLGGRDVKLSQIGAWMVASSHKNFQELEMNDYLAFLDGLIVFSRGTKDKPQVPPYCLLMAIHNLGCDKNLAALDALAAAVADTKKGIAEGRFDQVAGDED
ncbi:MAG: hypothetical protein RL095_2466 [Verrucomicrobiota bacterium]|jgi:uncharacterized protein YehS (DUF1456 family)